MNILGFFQRLGRALQLPIAVLPVAALLLRFGQPDLLNVAFIAQAGGAIFDNLALIFAIGVASSWSKDSAGAAALAGAVGYFVLTKAMVTINPEINMGVLAGIITGLVGGAAYNRWSDIKLPDFLSFFGGKRFVPIATGFFCLVLAAIFVIDTPGIKGFGTIEMEGAEIAHYFPEIFKFSADCRFNNCSHRHEPGCAVLRAVEEHCISESRYKSYLSILDDKQESKYREEY